MRKEAGAADADARSRTRSRVMAWARKIVEEGAAHAHNGLKKRERPEMMQAELIVKKCRVVHIRGASGQYSACIGKRMGEWMQ